MKTAVGVVPDILEYVSSGEGVRTRMQAVLLSASTSSWLTVSLLIGMEPQGVKGIIGLDLTDACQCAFPRGTSSALVPKQHRLLHVHGWCH